MGFMQTLLSRSGRGLAFTAPTWTRASPSRARRRCIAPNKWRLASLRMTTSSTTYSSIKGIEHVQEAVLDVLNELFDPADVARGQAMAKLTKKKKKKKSESKEPPEMDEAQIQAIADEAAANAKPFDLTDAMVTPATQEEFGDYQCNAAMGLAKAIGMNPRQVATQILEALQPRLEDTMEEPEIAGPGFINLRYKEDYLTSAVSEMAKDSTGRLALPFTSNKQKIVVDYSSPNIAKEMHVGHLRSTIIGDTLCNVLEFAGHDIIRLNHVGDWGTQFGMLVEHLRDEYPDALDPTKVDEVNLGDLVTLYKASKKRFDDDDEFKTRAREGVVKLQSKNPEAISAWEALCAASRKEYQKIYDILDIKGLEERGESFYNPFLLGVVEDLQEQGLAVESEGATVVFLDGFKVPILVRKSDGGFNYATTDLAAVRHRTQMASSEGGEAADRVLYVTDASQSPHFQMVFQAAKLAHFVPDGVSLEHVPFGLVQGEDGKKLATRSGETIKLQDLLDEAVRIAANDMEARLPEHSDSMSEQVKMVAKTVGIGAVKYADLSMNRESNYKFSYERMLSLNGNTAPYMLYAYARICGIVRKATDQPDDQPVKWPEASDVIITHPSELRLIRNLVRLPDVLSEVEKDLYPSRLCDYLFETSQKFNQFYGSCSVKNAETPEIKNSRLSLCMATAGTIRILMELLGIGVVEKL